MNKLFCYGDSNTFGWDPTDPLGARYDRPWVAVLQELSGIECLNKGRPGRRLPESRSEFDTLSRVVAQSGADALLILLGTNNRFLAPTDEPETAAAKMDTLLAFLRSEFPAMALYLIGLPPMRLPGSDCEGWVREVNGLYEALARKYALPFFDPTPLDLPLCFDGLHLTEEGHRRLAEGLWQSGILETGK